MKTSFSIHAFLTACLLFVLCNFAAAICSADTPLRNWPVAEKGERSVNVRAIQMLLTAQGDKVSADGVFGLVTQRALRRFQSAHRLVASGATNDPTWEALLVRVYQGSKGPAVQAAQFELRNEGYAVAADGFFDLRMLAAVRKYQKQTGHTVDGIIGRNTWYELVGGYDTVRD